MTQQPIEQHLVISAPPAAVWDALTNTAVMPKWMGEAEMGISVHADWIDGKTISIRGFHHARFEAKGIVLAFEPMTLLRYTQMSSISRLKDEPQNYSTLEFRLTPVAGGTSLTVHVSGFPTATIYQHLAFYWRGTVGILKRFIESR